MLSTVFGPPRPEGGADHEIKEAALRLPDRLTRSPGAGGACGPPSEPEEAARDVSQAGHPVAVFRSGWRCHER